MRFGNSSDYFGWATHARRRKALNSATGKAFHAVAGGLTIAHNLRSVRRILPTLNSAVAICSKVTTPSNRKQRYK
jgi:hypothetical protein